MKEKLKKIYMWFGRLGDTVVSLFLILAYSHKGVAQKINRLKINIQNQEATILANGPSAREIVNERKELIKGTDLLVVNDFGNTEFFFDLKPKYYILLDPTYFNFSFKHPGLNEKNEDTTRINKLRLFNNLKEVDWPMQLFVPSGCNIKTFISLFDANPNINVISFNATRVLGFDGFQNVMYGHGLGLPTSRNVIIPAMILMVILGYKKVFLYGCEISWTKTMDVDPENGQMFFNDRHFYSKDEIRYFGKGAYLWWLEAISEMLRGVEQVAKFAKSNGVHIVNRTKGSFIDSFDYENPDTIKSIKNGLE